MRLNRDWGQLGMSFSNRLTMSLDDVCLKVTDGSHFSPKESIQGHPMLSVKDMTEYGFDYSSCKRICEDDYKSMLRNDCVPKRNDILVAKDGSYLKHIFVTKEEREEAILSSIAIFRPNLDMVYPSYFCYILKNPVMKQTIKDNYVSGSAVPRIVLKDFKKIQIEIPSLLEQKSIADTLSCIDDKIEINNSINKTLEEIAQAIFKSWFVDFEPFQDGEFEESDLGRIPKGWREVEFSQISTVQNGYAFKSTDYQENGCNMIRTTNIDWDGFVNNSDLIHLPNTFLTDSKYKNFTFNNLDTVLVMVGASVGKIGIITEKNIPALQNQNMWRFRPIHEGTSPIYIHYYVKLINERVRNWSSGSARDFYRKGSFQNAKCIYPTDDVMDSYQETIQGIFNKISLNVKESELLTIIRDSLLPKIMNSEILVPVEEVK